MKKDGLLPAAWESPGRSCVFAQRPVGGLLAGGGRPGGRHQVVVLAHSRPVVGRIFEQHGRGPSVGGEQLDGRVAAGGGYFERLGAGIFPRTRGR